jgi:dolichol-phosphate mannosyltransferase
MVRTVSVVIPVLNEEENVERAYNTVTTVLAELSDRYEYEIIFTDNHSTDATYEIVKRLAQRDPRVRAARFSRNFGYQKSIFAAYALSSGDAVVQLDCDLQDPPAMIPDMLQKWEEGYHVVYGVRRSRKEGVLIRNARRFFYRLINWMSDDELPPDAGDFRLLDRRIVDELTRFGDYNPYLRGTIAWMGFTQIGLPYEREARTAGETKFSLGKMVSLALDGILAHSILPLRLATGAGLLMGVAAIFGAIVYLVGRFFLGQDWPAGFASLVIILMISISMNGIFLGVIGEYLSRMYLQSKGRPMVLLESSVNLDAPTSIRARGRTDRPLELSE